MPLEPFVESLDNIEENTRSFYVEAEDGGYVLDVDVTQHPGARALKNALDAERKKAKDAKQKAEKFEGIDLDRWQTLSALSDEELDAFRNWQDKQKNGKDSDGDTGESDFEERLTRATARMRDDHAKELKIRDEKIAELTEDRNKLTDNLRKTVIDQGLTSVAANKGAYDPKDILSRAEGIWRMDENNQPTAFDEDGEVIRGKDGVSPITMEEWVEAMSQKASHLFKENLGGGAPGSNGQRNGKFARIKTKADLKTTKDKVDFIREHGQKEFEELPT